MASTEDRELRWREENSRMRALLTEVAAKKCGGKPGCRKYPTPWDACLVCRIRCCLRETRDDF